MSLGRLLATGKSLVGGRNMAHRFQENKRVALPKFISPKNPFLPVEQPASAEARTHQAVPTDAETVRTTNAPAAAAAPRLFRPVRSLTKLAAWGLRLNPLQLWKGDAKAISAVSTPKVTQPVQTELSLDAVQVVRNDLTDADAETIPAMVVARPFKSSPMLAMSAKAEAVGQAMDRWSSRLFGDGHP